MASERGSRLRQAERMHQPVARAVWRNLAHSPNKHDRTKIPDCPYMQLFQLCSTHPETLLGPGSEETPNSEAHGQPVEQQSGPLKDPLRNCLHRVLAPGSNSAKTYGIRSPGSAYS